MTLQTIFEKVNRKSTIGKTDFFSFYASTVSELINTYGNLIVTGVLENSGYLSEELCIHPAFSDAIADNIIALHGKIPDYEAYKSEFLRKSKSAYKRIWSSHAKRAKIIYEQEW